MSFKAVAWLLVAALACTTVIVFNYWAAYQPLSTLAYSGIVLALCGLANLIVPFGFLGIRKRTVGVLILAGGVAIAAVALLWPAPMIRVAQHKTGLDDAMPEYQFNERHSSRIHAQPDRVMQAVRESTFGDMKSLATLVRVRAAALRIRDTGNSLQDRRILDAFSESGFLTGGNEHEVVMFGVAVRPRPQIQTMQEFTNYRGQGGVKMAFNLKVQDAGGGWSTISTETRVLALDEATRQGMGRYWRLIVPGSGLLRLQWLDGIRKRAETSRT